MLKRAAAIFAVMMTICVAASAADLKDPKQIISKAKERLLAMDNYSFTVEKEGWDFDMEKTANATKNLTGEAAGGALTKNLAKDVEQVDSTKPKWMTYTSEYKFMKPWVLWMKIVKSDYVPDMLQGAIMRYNYVKNKKKWSIKTSVIIVGIPRGIETESGNFMYSGWHMNLINLESLAMDTTPKLAGIVKVNGRNAYKIELPFNDKVKPQKHKVDLSKWNVPKEVQFKLEPETEWFATHKVGNVYYYFDKETLDLVQEEVMQPNGKQYYKKVWKNITINKLSKKDMG